MNISTQPYNVFKIINHFPHENIEEFEEKTNAYLSEMEDSGYSLSRFSPHHEEGKKLYITILHKQRTDRYKENF